MQSLWCGSSLSRNSFRVGHTILTSPQFSLTGRKESALLVTDATALTDDVALDESTGPRVAKLHPWIS